MTHSPITNIAAYKFAPLADLKELREELRLLTRAEELKGTILLSTEGINLFVAGREGAIGRLLARLRQIPGLEDLEVKASISADQPFTRMLVKIKKEIIAFGVEGIDPARQPAARISPTTLKRWLDEGKPLTLLDTRNDFEIALGTFSGAQAIGIAHFREFPEAARNLSVPDDGRPIVTFCTGGIRCEKAAPYLVARGFSNVFQLDGGILKYFEECGSAHYDGECFVFDKRVGLGANLDPSGHGFCHVCQSILSRAELDDPRMVAGVSCPYCHRSEAERSAETLAKRRARLLDVTTPLPGRLPNDNHRPLKVPARHDGWRMIDFLATILGHISRAEWRAYAERGAIVDKEREPVALDRVVRAGECYFTVERMQVEPDVNVAIDILHEDDALIVLNKPAPLPTHPCGRFHRNTLSAILRDVYAPQKPRPAHRLDANTSGVVVFTRTSTFARLVQPQFERSQVRKEYLARVLGHPLEDRFHSEAAISATSGRQGSRDVTSHAGLPSFTEFHVLSRDDDGTALLWVKPRTGRTNQIRIHAWDLGFPLQGDPMYLPGRELGDRQTTAVDEAPLCLHSWRLTFTHPLLGQEVTYEAPRPTWAMQVK